MKQDRLLQYAAQLRQFMDPGPNCPLPSEVDFSELAQQLFRCQFELNPVYRAWCRRAGPTPSSSFNWRDLPALPVEAFKELHVSCLPEAERTTEFRSSGTTGSLPSRHFHHPSSLQVYEMSALQGFAPRLATGKADLILSLTPPLTETPQSSLVHMVDLILHTFGQPGCGCFGRNTDDGWTVDTDTLRSRLQAATTPLILLGTAFNFVHLLDSLPGDASALRLPAGSRIMETGGYKGRSREIPRSELHTQLAQRLGLPATAIFTEYGMCELSSQAYTEPSTDPALGPILRFPNWARALVVSPETGREVAEGQSGLLRVIDLANAWSVLAIQTSDLAVRRGNHFELIGRAPSAEARGCSLKSVASG